jgi:hypothetical protein
LNSNNIRIQHPNGELGTRLGPEFNKAFKKIGPKLFFIFLI